MDFIVSGFRDALLLLLSLDAELLEIIARSLFTSGTAVFLAMLVGIPAGALLGLGRFTGRRFLKAVVSTAMGLPPVVVGLVVLLLLARRGPFGVLHLLYSVKAMILAQFVLALPVLTALTASSLGAVEPNLRLQVLALGASRRQYLACLLWEARNGIYTAVLAAFGRVSAEVGAVMMVGGNIRHETRVLTTATVLEARQGNYERAIALGMVLLGLAFVVNACVTMRRESGRLA